MNSIPNPSIPESQAKPAYPSRGFQRLPLLLACGLALLPAPAAAELSTTGGSGTVGGGGGVVVVGGGGEAGTATVTSEIEIERKIKAGTDRARREVARAETEVAKAVESVRRQVGQAHLSFKGSANLRTLMVPRPDTTEEQLADAQEQLAIMSRIVSKAADPEASGRSGFRFRLAGLGLGNGTDLDAIYLDGYGATFLVSADYPLVEPAKVTEKKLAPPADKDATWEKTRRELAGTPADEEWTDDLAESESAPAFDADRVAALKRRLVESFKHATNLKILREGSDRVTLVVSGRGPKSTATRVAGGTRVTEKVVGYMNDGKEFQVFDFNHGQRSQQLTLTARKSDIDAFAAGRLSLEEFTRKVVTTTQAKLPVTQP
jgi:hypothetical protein